MAATLFVFSQLASAQGSPYVWLDEKGVKQFSDQPPPPSVPKSKIIKYSGKSIDTLDSTPDSDSDTSKTAKQPESVAEKEAAYKKRHDELAAKQKKADEEASTAKTKAENCKRMSDYKASLASGQRISETDANGNRSYLTDEQRSQQISAMDQNLSSCGN